MSHTKKKKRKPIIKMSRQAKGWVAFAFLGGILLTSLVVIGIPGILPQQQVTVTNTPQDRFADVDRPAQCGTPGAGSTPYVQEYEISRPCTKPLAITTDDEGNVWFTQTNTGNLGMFDPDTGEFSEFFNPSWPQADSMMWGIEHYEDGSIWYTEDRLNSVWKYIIDEGAYLNVRYGEGDDTFPHRITELGTQLVINDYTGGRVNFFNPTPGSNDLGYWTLDSPDRVAITSEVAFDSSFDMWYTNWRNGEGGSLVRFNVGDYYEEFNDLPDNSTDIDIDPDNHITTFELPEGAPTINGVAVDGFNRIWLTDTNSSNIYRFDTFSEEYTKYTTPRPQQASYGNFSGAIIEPISRPYFADTDDRGRIVFNEQAGNRISVLNPFTETLIEYTIPSRNPNWSDCEEDDTSCGIAQVLGFDAVGDEIWFTEWVENNIGVVDTSVEPPYEISLDPQTVTMTANATESIIMSVGVRGPIVYDEQAATSTITITLPEDETTEGVEHTVMLPPEIADGAGNAVGAGSQASAAWGAEDGAAPEFMAAFADATTLVITFGERLGEDARPLEASAYTVSVPDGTIDSGDGSADVIEPDTIVYNEQAATSTITITLPEDESTEGVEHTVMLPPEIADGAGNAVGAGSQASAAWGAEDGAAPEFMAAFADATTLVITFGERLGEDARPLEAAAYTVSVPDGTIDSGDGSADVIEPTSIVGEGQYLEMSSTSGIFGVDVELEEAELPESGTVEIAVEIRADEAREGTHKVALGVADDDIAVTRYLTIVIEGEEEPAGEPMEIVVEPLAGEQAGEPMEIVVEPLAGEQAGESMEIVVEPLGDAGEEAADGGQEAEGGDTDSP